MAIYMRDGWRCVYCQRFAFPDGRISLDHLQSQCMGGGTESSNLVTCCWWCNTHRHAMPPEAFVADVALSTGQDPAAVVARISAAGSASSLERMRPLHRRAKAICAAKPAWLVELRARCSNAANAAGVDGERRVIRDRMARHRATGAPVDAGPPAAPPEVLEQWAPDNVDAPPPVLLLQQHAGS